MHAVLICASQLRTRFSKEEHIGTQGSFSFKPSLDLHFSSAQTNTELNIHGFPRLMTDLLRLCHSDGVMALGASKSTGSFG